MLLTNEMIEAGKSFRGGFNIVQVWCLGFDMSYKWKRYAAGTFISQEKYDLFIELRDAHIGNGPKRLLYNKLKKDMNIGKKRHTPQKIVKHKKTTTYVKIKKMINYKEQYSHPNWQRTRLKVFSRDGFKCTQCGDRNKMIHVHHLRYTAKYVWEEPLENLTTLCDTCHKKYHNKLFD